MIKLNNISKEYLIREQSFKALDEITLTFPQKGIVFIVGESGSGKSTLLSILGGILTPSYGEYYFNDLDVLHLNAKERERFLREKVSFVFQDYNLIEDFSVRENLSLVGINEKEIDIALSSVSLLNKAKTPVKYLSGGEKQRLAIARAVSKKNEVLLMDEPTGNLDSNNSKEIMKILKKISREKLVIVVTHDKGLVYEFGDYFLSLYDGKMVEFQEITENGIDVEISDSIPASFLSVIHSSSFLKTKEIIVIGKDFKKRIVLPYENKVDYFLSILDEFHHQKLKIQLIEEEKETKAVEGSGISTLSFKSQFHYACRLIFRRLGRAISSALILSLSLGLLLLHSSLTFFDTKAAMENAFQYLDTSFVPVYKEEGKKTYRQGRQVHLEIAKDFGYAMPVFKGELENRNSNLYVYIAAIDKPISFCGKTIEPPKENSLVISSFLSKLIKNKTIKLNFTYYVKHLSMPLVTMNIAKTIDIAYEKNDLDAFLSDSLSDTERQKSILNEKKDTFISKYMIAFASTNGLKSVFSKNAKYYAFNSNDFSSASHPSRDYINSACRYSLYKNEKLVKGEPPRKGDEVTVSKEFAELLVKENSETKGIDEVIGKYYPFQEIEVSENYDHSLIYPDMHAISSGVTVVGVHENATGSSDVLANPSLYQKIADEVFEYPDCYYAYSDSYSSLAEKLSKSKYVSAYYSMGTIYFFDRSIKHNSGINFLFGLGASFLALGVLFLNLFCSLNVKEKRHEIATMKSLGISSKRISSIFLIESGFVLIVAFLLGVVLSLIGIHLANGIFKNMGGNRIAYNLITLSPFICFIAFFLVLLLSSCSTILPILKTRKLDIVSSLKESK